MRWALALVFLAEAAQAEIPIGPSIGSAWLSEPTDRYDHAVLGDALEWGALEMTLASGVLHVVTIRLPDNRVFEDVEARLADLDGDDRDEVIVVETDLARGASLAVYGPEGKIAATRFIGQKHRWLAPAGIADFDGDGRVEIAYVDRPHILGDLVFVRLEGDRLVETQRLPGLTNHRIGDDFISGGVRDCGQGPELVLASLDWTRVMRVRGGKIKDIGPMPAKGLKIPPC
ncbi:VCBS repeat-containing protein [Tabrizicola sp.]|uniref:VCBS repeat-containing protein n=1 Tax=Tabrizicola sp. TaxID=2005166 RepID=UPI003F2B56D7